MAYNVTGMANDTAAQKRLLAYLAKRSPDLSDKDKALVLNGIRRFVILAREIYTEPQARVTYETIKLNNGKKATVRVFNTNIEELAKVKDKPILGIQEMAGKFTQKVTKNEHE